MEQARVYQTISLVCFGIGGVFLITAMILFFKLRIVEVIGELTGRTAKRQIEAYRSEAVKVRSVSKSGEDEMPEIPYMFQNVEKRSAITGTGETILLIDPMKGEGENTAVLQQDEEEEEKTSVMGGEFRIVKDEMSKHAKEVLSDI